MTDTIDIHTHRTDARHAIINVPPDFSDFKPGLLYSAGLHPWWIENSAESLISRLPALFSTHQCLVAVGECGIDLLKPVPTYVQEKIFMSHIMLSEQLGLPLIVHCVRAWQQTIALHRRFHARQPWIIHGFRGKPTVLASLLSEGFYISCGEHCNEQSLPLIPAERLLLETDSSAMPIGQVAESAAAVLGITARQLTDVTNANACSLFPSLLSL